MLLNREKQVVIGLLLCAAVWPGVVFAAEAEDNFFQMSLDELAQEPYEIVSASRQGQAQNELSIPVTVITAEDIHYSGLTMIPDILRFYLGVDVVSYDRNLYGVGVRGMHDTVSDRTLVLIDGRNATNPAFGGMEWEKFPVILEDIDRIEVVRGPGGAAWGANAENGVINIITKKPQDVQGFLGSTTWTEYGDSYTHFRYGGAQEKWSYRISGAYQNRSSSDAAGAGEYVSGNTAITSIPSMGFSSFKARDLAHDWFFDTEAVYQASEETQWTMGAAYSYTNTGSYELMGTLPAESITTNWTRLFSRIDQVFNEDVTGYVQWYGNYYIAHSPVLTTRYATFEDDLEMQINWSASERNTVSLGGNLRWVRVDVDNVEATDIVMTGGGVNEQWAGLFLIDRYQFSERITLEGQVRGDWYSGTQADWSARGTALYTLDKAGHHILRLSTARAFRAPSNGFRETTSMHIPIGGGVYAINYGLPSKDLVNEESWSFEGGYSGQLDESTSIRADLYWQEYENLVGVIPGTVNRLANIDGARAYGAECEVSKRFGSSRVSAWYAYNTLDSDQNQQQLRACYPSRHKSGLQFRHQLENQWVFNANYVFNDTMDTYASTLGDSIETINRLDLTMSAPVLGGQGEVLIGVADVFDKTHKAAFTAGGITAHTTPGRMFFGRFQYRF